MASVSQTETLTTSEKPLENKVNEEAKLMEKEIVLPETADVVEDKPDSDSNLTVTKEDQIDQTPAVELEKESPAVMEDIAVVLKAEESTEKGKDENGEKVVEQGEQEGVEDVIVKAVDEEKAEEKDENGEKKVTEEVELIEPTLVKEDVLDAEKAEEKVTVESVAEEDNEDKEVVDVSESTDEAIGKQVEPVDVESVKDISTEDKIKDVEVLEVEPKPEPSEKVETQPEKGKELAPEVEVVKAEETPETTEQAKVELEGKLEDINVETKDSGINVKDEKTSESVSSLCPEEIVPINQDSDIAPNKEPEGDASSHDDVIEKAITEKNHVVDEPSKDEKISEPVSALCLEKVVPTNPEKETEGENHVVEEPSKNELEKLATEDENIKKDNEPFAESMSKETLKETDTESREKETAANKQEKTITEKVAAEVIETTPIVKERDEPKQQQEVTAKEVVVKKKQSKSIISKLKQSLVKAKKAIIGKSQNSKNISTEDVKVQ